MAAVAYPSPHTGARGTRPSLRLVPPAPRLARRRGMAVYRRRRVAVALVLAAGVLVLALLGHWLGGGPLTAPEPRPTAPVPVVASVYIVQPGDTLWTLARRSQPTGDLRPLVDRLAAAQRHQRLRAGQRIILP